MPRLIQSQARGLLSLLTSKDGGIGPTALEDNLRATVDISPFYGLNGRTDRFVAQTAAQLDAAPNGWIAAGGALTMGWKACYPASGNLAAGVPNIAVPEGEIWRVFGVTAVITRVTGAGALFVHSGWAHGMFPSFVFCHLGTSSGVPQVGMAGSSGSPDISFLALPGSCAAIFFTRWDLGVDDANVEMYVNYERLPL